MMTVFIVTTGDYSSYEIFGVYPTVEAAREAAGSPISYRVNDSTQIQEWVLGSDGVRSERAEDGGARRGVALSASIYRSVGYGGRSELVVNNHEHPHGFAHFDPDIWVDEQHSRVTVYAVDRDRGLKALRDAVARIKAREEGIG